ncbi:SHOCT domain-containing protein [Streptomyces sp. NPDC048567]|uniref:SHOCT domain-containing protein n=1 Tax=Streptomyces TaxID=1883 RepID=UPI000CD4CC19|nr:SHOCT domain-containing protein [Streptomyces sp. SM13]MCD9899692.1 SHOCT domain-containing protein [Streptomyces sp. MT29]WSV25285.1 SHOCT domain-containing protein [Streptomyces fimicarius]
MNLAYDYPVLGAFWTVMWIFLWVLWIVLLFRIIGDVFRDDTLSGAGKTGWLVFVLLIPFLGVFVYVLSRGKGMGKREVRHAQAQQQALDDYIRTTAGEGAGPGSETEQLATLSDLRSKGDISDEEFQRAKEKILH